MSGFFNPTEIPDGSRDVKCTATDPANSMATMKLTRLPQPEITFKPPSTISEVGRMHLMLFIRNSKSHIVGAEQRGNALLYDADWRTVEAISRRNHPEVPAHSLTVGDSLCVMYGLARRFEALTMPGTTDGTGTGALYRRRRMCLSQKSKGGYALSGPLLWSGTPSSTYCICQ
jgi:hypothetical protein